MNTRFPALLALAAALTACSTTPHWDSRFGDAVRASLAAQVIDQAAVRNANPAAGVDAKAGRGALERYHASFRAPPPPAPPISVFLGGGK
jgi:hypothetical protein